MNKENVYLIRGKNGEYASGTKVCSSSRGATSTMNKFIDGAIYTAIQERYSRQTSYDHPLYELYTCWCWRASKSEFSNWDSFQKFNDREIRSGFNVTRISKAEYDEYVKIVNDIYDYWSVEEVKQNGNISY